MKSYRKSIIIITSTLTTYIAMIWALSYLWSILPAWTNLPIVATGIIGVTIGIPFLLWGIDELPDYTK